MIGRRRAAPASPVAQVTLHMHPPVRPCIYACVCAGSSAGCLEQAAERAREAWKARGWTRTEGGLSKHLHAASPRTLVCQASRATFTRRRLTAQAE